MANKIVYFALFMMRQRRAPSPRSRTWELLVLLGFLGVFAFVGALIEAKPLFGLPLCYVLVATLPILFGIKWSSTVLTDADRRKLRENTGPARMAVIFAIIGMFNYGMRLLAGIGVNSWVNFAKWVGMYIAGGLAVEILGVYLPFSVARAISRRYSRMQEEPYS